MTIAIPMLANAVPHSLQDAGLALRLAQRAFAALLDVRGDLSGRAMAQRGHALRRCLSALSADDRDRFVRWLALLRASRQSVAPGQVAQAATHAAPSRRSVRQPLAAA